MKFNVNNIFIAFTGEMSEGDIEYLDKFIKDEFPHIKLVSKIHNMKEYYMSEIIYELQPPVFDTKIGHSEFFRKLSVIFDEFKGYSPYFTEFKEV